VTSTTPHRILVIAPSWIGDTVAAQPLFMRLHQKHPHLQLDVMAPAYVAPVLRRMPQVSDIIDNPFGHGETRLRDRWRVARKLAARSYDEAIVLPNSLKSALVPLFAGIGKRVGFVGEARVGLLNRVHRLDSAATPQIAERYAQLAEEPGVRPPRPLPMPAIEASDEGRGASLAALGLATDRPVVAFCPGAEYGPAKRWPAPYFAELGSRICQLGYAVWLIGARKDIPVGAEIAGAAPGCINLCGRTTLDQAIDLLASSTFVVSNDCGLMHIAAALDRPMIALFGSSSPGYTPPLSAKAEVMWLKPECSPCFKRECPLGHFRCMLELTPDLVLAQIHSHLAADSTARCAFGNNRAAALPSAPAD
jgi:heptosyltransferase-2